MQVVDEEVARELMRSPDPDAALVFVKGRCLVVSLAEDATPGAGVLIARRREITTEPPEALSGARLHAIACCLDNRARDMCT